MFYVYILNCGDGKFYAGFTSNLKKRINEHQNGLVMSTKGRQPVTLLFYEAYVNKYDALRRENILKPLRT